MLCVPFKTCIQILQLYVQILVKKIYNTSSNFYIHSQDITKKLSKTQIFCVHKFGSLFVPFLYLGKYDLKAEARGRNVSLTWKDFQPPNYPFEYSVAFWPSLTTSLTRWTKVEVSIPICLQIIFQIRPCHVRKIQVFSYPWT